jgi:hypothetical protein
MRGRAGSASDTDVPSPLIRAAVHQPSRRRIVAAVRRGLVLMPSDLIDLFAIAYAAWHVPMKKPASD